MKTIQDLANENLGRKLTAEGLDATAVLAAGIEFVRRLRAARKQRTEILAAYRDYLSPFGVSAEAILRHVNEQDTERHGGEPARVTLLLMAAFVAETVCGCGE